MPAFVPDPGDGDHVAGLYIHWPYCARICPYCDFNVYKAGPVDTARWTAAFDRALAAHHARWPDLRLGSLFFGGGTPSLMPPALVAHVIDRATALWPQEGASLEVSLEANPTSTEQERFADLAAAGVNRLSLGLQSLDDDTLAFLGRDHDADEAVAALNRAIRHFLAVSADLIYALPDQTPAAWESELARVLEAGVAHLSAYQLTVEPGTAFARQVERGAWQPCDAERAADLYALTGRVAAQAGLPAYEISNHARPGHECRHNLGYWQGRPYLGIGPGAHGRLPVPDGPGGMLATVAAKRPGAWLAAVEDGGTGLETEERLTPEGRGEEMVLLGLRQCAGLDLRALARRTGLRVEAVMAADALHALLDEGLLRRTDDRLVVPSSARALTDAIAMRLLTGGPEASRAR